MIRQRIRALAATVATAAMLLAGATPAMAAKASFTDLAGASHVDDIDWVASNGIAKGYEDGTFGVMRDVVRQDMAAFLYRLAGSPAFDQTAAERANTFRDVTPAISHYKEVLWLTQTGITKGYGDGTFGVMRTVVRQDMAAFLHRYATNVLHAQEPTGQPQSFKDVNPATSHYDDIVWLSKTGITKGYDDGTFGAMRTVVRQDMAAFLHRTHDNLKVDNGGNKPTVEKVTLTLNDGRDNTAKTVSLDKGYQLKVDQGTLEQLLGVKEGSLAGLTGVNTKQDGTGTATTLGNTLTITANTTLYLQFSQQLQDVKIKKVIAGNTTTYAIGEDGSLWAWGENGYGQLGDGTTTNHLTPIKVPISSKVANVTIGSNGSSSDDPTSTVYVTGEDGSLWTWGYNRSGQVGDGTSGYANAIRTNPYKVSGLPKVANITIHGSTVYVTGEDDSLWAWGSNDEGEVGDGTASDDTGTYKPNNRTVPYKLPILSKVTSIKIIAVEWNRTTVYVNGADGSLWAWGSNGYGQVGDGTTTKRLTPYKMSGLPNLDDITVEGGGNDTATLFLTGKDGSLWTWGSNGGGEIGDGTTTDRPTPYKVEGIPAIAKLTIANGTIFVTGKDGSLWAWGMNDVGQVGDGTYRIKDSSNFHVRTTPYHVPIPAKVSKFDFADILYGPAMFVTDDDGNFWTWGYNFGLKTDEEPNAFVSLIATPYRLPITSKVAQFSFNLDTYYDHCTAYVTGTDGTLWAWGYNSHGQLGNGTTDSQGLYRVANLPAVTSVVVHTSFEVFNAETEQTINVPTVLALDKDGSIWTWGYNGSGQVGDGTTTDRLTPYKVPGLPKIISISDSRYDSMYANGEDGSQWEWGTGNQLVPTKVDRSDDRPAGYDKTPYVDEDGNVWTWGSNKYGEIGDGTTNDRTTSLYKVPGLPKIANISEGSTMYAIGVDGSLWAWGYNQHGQVGDGTTTNRLTPYKMQFKQ